MKHFIRIEGEVWVADLHPGDFFNPQRPTAAEMACALNARMLSGYAFVTKTGRVAFSADTVWDKNALRPIDKATET